MRKDHTDNALTLAAQSRTELTAIYFSIYKEAALIFSKVLVFMKLCF